MRVVVSRAPFTLVALLLAACGGAETNTRGANDERASHIHEVSDATRARLDRVAAAQVSSMAWSDALTQCPENNEQCLIATAASYDAHEHLWSVMNADYSEAGLSRVWVGNISIDASHANEEGPPTAERLSRVRTFVEMHSQMTPARNLIAQSATEQFSLNEYVPIVVLAAPLEGWGFEIETTGLDSRQYVARLINPARTRAVELGRMSARVGPCDGDGGECVEPLGISHVSLADDETSLLILGSVQVAAHGGYPAFRWVLGLNREARAFIHAN